MPKKFEFDFSNLSIGDYFRIPALVQNMSNMPESGAIYAEELFLILSTYSVVNAHSLPDHAAYAFLSDGLKEFAEYVSIDGEITGVD